LVTFDPVIRAGAACRPLRWFNVAADLDLNAVDSGVVRDLDYRYVNFGAEFLLGRWFAGRVGAYKNLGNSRSNTVVTGGICFGVPRFSVDLVLGAAAERAGFGGPPASGLGPLVAPPTGSFSTIYCTWAPPSRAGPRVQQT
jgi:hypothetical protein